MSNEFGLYGLGVMGQNLALNIAEHGFNISVANRSEAKVDTCVERYEKEILGDEAMAANAGKLEGFKDLRAFVDSLKKPRCIMFLVKAGRCVCSWTADALISIIFFLLPPHFLLPPRLFSSPPPLLSPPIPTPFPTPTLPPPPPHPPTYHSTTQCRG